MESMSNAPHYVYGMRNGIKAGNQSLVDGMIHDGLWDSFSNQHMGNLAEYTAKKAGVSRADQDAFALASHRKAVAAMEACHFKAETVAVEIPGKKGPTVIEKDEGPRADTSLEALAALKPSFEKDGTVTAGNAPGVNDGAAALIVMSEDRAASLNAAPLARIAGYSTSGLPPKLLLMTPVTAVTRLLEKVGWNKEQVDLFEINEAFAAQMVAVINELGIDPARVNVNGGAIALGHPVGVSGTRIVIVMPKYTRP